MKHFFTLLVLAFTAVASAAEYAIPTARRPVSWEANVITGVVGGIPTRSGGNVINVADYGWSSGASAATNTAAFNSARAASAEGDIISIPAGTFSINGIQIGYAGAHNNRTVRGAGVTATILNTANTCDIGSGGQGGDSRPSSAVTTITRNSSTITVADGSTLWSSGRVFARIAFANEAVTPTVSVYGYDTVRTMDVVIIGRTGNNLTLSQPMPHDYAAALAAGTCTIQWISQLTWQSTGIGLEDLTIDGGGTLTFAVVMSWAENCWMKNVKVTGPANYATYMVDTVNCEISHSIIDGAVGGTSKAGLLMDGCSYALIEDNILSGGPAIEIRSGGVNCVFGYNTYYQGNCHGPHPSHNLWEGNAHGFPWFDGYFGGISEETIFRNWMWGDVSAIFKRFTRNMNYIGNIVGTMGQTYTSDFSEYWGTPNIGNFSSSGTASLLGTGGASPWADWDTGTDAPLLLPGTLTTRTSATSGVITLDTGGGALLAASNAANGATIRGGFGHNFITISNITGDVVTFDTGSGTNPAVSSSVTILPSPPAFQQQDLDVAATTDRKANYYVFTGNIPAGESLGGDTIPTSYYRTSKPDWFGTLNWPPFDSSAPGTPALQSIPAGWRSVYDNEDYLGGGSGTPVYSPARLGPMGARRR